MGFIGADDDLVVCEVDVGDSKIGEFGDTHASLEEEFDYGKDARIGSAGVAKGTIFELT